MAKYNDPIIILCISLTSEFIGDYHYNNAICLPPKVQILNQCFSPVKLFVSQGESEKSAREKPKLLVANHEIKKFHGQIPISGDDLDKTYIVTRGNFEKSALFSYL